MGPLEITFEMGNWGYKQDKWSEISLLINGLLSPSLSESDGNFSVFRVVIGETFCLPDAPENSGSTVVRF